MSVRESLLLLVVVIILALVTSPVRGQNRGQVRIQDNGYRGILLAISDDVPEDPELIPRIQKVFTDTSQTLYQATHQRSYLHDVTLLIPKSWKNTPALPAAREGFDKSDIVVDVSNKQYGQGDRPFTLKTTGCGENGHFIRLTDKYLLDDKEADKYGPYEKVMTHEWAHYRFGLFDEYQGDNDDKDHFYAGRGGKTQATRCSGQLTGRMYNRNNGADGCKYVGQMPEPGCRFRDDVMHGKYASIMYKTRLAHLVEFCDHGEGKAAQNNEHNSEAPTQHNRQCQGRSAWEVLREHPDFNGVNEPNPGLDTTPEFRIVRESSKRTVLILDVSGSMNTNNRLEKLGHGCSNYIWNVIRDAESLGIVWFQSTARIKKAVTEVTEETRPDLVANIPTTAGGATSIGDGLKKGLKALMDHNNSTQGGTLIVVSDGAENRSPFIHQVIDEVRGSGVTVHTIAFTDDADSGMESLAQSTGGLSFLFTDSDTSNALNEAFRQIGELNMDPEDRRYTLFSEAESVKGTENATGSVRLDGSLGRETDIVIDYSRDPTKVTLTSPSGQTYDENDPICKQDKTFKAYTFSIPKVAEAGEWRFLVTNGDSRDQRIALTVSTKSAVRGEAPIVSRASWGRRNLALNGSASAKQAIYVMVSKGYAAVLRADVNASVECPGSPTVDLLLRDNGAGADATADDGVYSTYFLQFSNNGRYNVKVSVNNKPTTVISSQRIIGRGAPAAEEDRPVQHKDHATGDFQRFDSGGSFQLTNYAGVKVYAPGTVTDLRVADAGRGSRDVTLQWTAVGDQLDVGTATRYELRMADTAESLVRNFSRQALVTDDMITNGANLTEPKQAGQDEEFVIKINEIGEFTYAFAVRAIDVRGTREEVVGEVSNVVSVSMADFPQVTTGLGAGAIAGIAMGCVALVVIVAAAVLVVVQRRGTAYQTHGSSSSSSSSKSPQPPAMASDVKLQGAYL